MAHVETLGLVLNLCVLGVPHIGWVVSSLYIYIYLLGSYIMLYSHEKSPWYLHILILYGTDMAHLKNRLLKKNTTVAATAEDTISRRSSRIDPWHGPWTTSWSGVGPRCLGVVLPCGKRLHSYEKSQFSIAMWNYQRVQDVVTGIVVDNWWFIGYFVGTYATVVIQNAICTIHQSSPFYRCYKPFPKWVVYSCFTHIKAVANLGLG